MDLETENRLAALLMEEARRSRMQADKEGVHVYLQKSNVRGRPNSRFLTATVLGVQQANRVVEVSDMWRAREKERELDAKLKSRSKDTNIHERCDHGSSRTGSSARHKEASLESKKIQEHDYSGNSDDDDDDAGLRDEEVERFLHSRAKRGRGAVGSRMDEPGPYMSPASIGPMVNTDTRLKEEWERRILGPEKPSFFEPIESDEDVHETKGAFTEKVKKHRSKEKRSKKEKEGKTKRKHTCSKHRHRHKRRRED